MKLKLIYRMNLIPSWKDLNHFSSVMDVAFTDGSKYEHISKVILIFISVF